LHCPAVSAILMTAATQHLQKHRNLKYPWRNQEHWNWL